MKPTSLTAGRVLQELKKCGITHIVALPDGECRHLYETIAQGQDFILVPVCREGEAIAIALGLWLGGKTPLVLHQNTGLFESGDSVRGIALDVHLPLLMMIDYRGWQRNAPLTDSAAFFLEPVLDTWGITHHLVETDEDAGKIFRAFKEAQEMKKPAAVLIGSVVKQS